MKLKIIATFIIIITAGIYLYSQIDAESTYEQGIEAFKSRNYGSSELLFRKIIESKDDEFIDRAWFYHARSIFYQKKYKAAIFDFTSFITKSRTASLTTEARFWMGESYYKLKQYVKSIEEYNRYISQNKRGRLVAKAHDKIASIYYYQRRYDESIIEWSSAIKKSKDRKKNAYLIYRIGEAQFKNKNYENSLKRLHPLITSGTNQKIVSNARIVIGRIYQKNNNHRKALTMFNSIPQNLLKDKKINDAQYFKALSHIKLNNSRKAITLLNVFLIIGKKSNWYNNGRFMLGKLLINTKDTKKGLELLEDVRKKSKNNELNINATTLLSEYYIKQEPSKAIPYLEESLKTEDSIRKKEVMLLLSRAYLKTKNFNKSEFLLQEYSKTYPYDPDIDEVNFLKARVYLEKGDITRAKKTFKNLEKNHPFSKYIHESKYYLALTYYKSGKPKKVISLLKSYAANKDVKHHFEAQQYLLNSYVRLKDRRNSGRVANGLIAKYIRKKDVEKSIYHYARALKRWGKNPWKYYRIILVKFPNSDTAMNMYFKIGSDFYKKNKYYDAITFYRKYLNGKLKDDRGLAYFNSLQSYYKLKQYEKVIETLAKGNIPPLDENQWNRIPILLSRSHYKLKNYDEVYNTLYLENIKHYNSNDLTMFAKSAIMVGDLSMATKIAGKLKKNRNRYAETLYEISTYYKNKHNYDGAKNLLSRIIKDAPKTKYADLARIDNAAILIRKRKYNQALVLLNKISNNSSKKDKNSLLVIAHFNSGNNKKALKLVQKHIYSIKYSRYGEMAIKRIVDYYFTKQNSYNFNKYLNYLRRYRDSRQYINYKSGKFNFATKYFQKSFISFLKLSNVTGPYYDEANYHLGYISLFIHKNNRKSLQYFTKTANSKRNTEYKWKSMINISIINNEIGNKKRSKANLRMIMENVNRGIISAQAKNLLEVYSRK